MDKPDVDFIEGLSPAISIDQKSASRNPRSTVGTITEIYDYLRLLYARIGVPHCPNCGRRDHPPDPAADRRPGAAAARGHPLPGARAGRARPQGRVRGPARRSSRGQGFTRARVDGEIVELADAQREQLARYENHTIEVVVDRLVRRAGIERRLTDSLETALRLAEGVAEVEIVANGDDDDASPRSLTFSEHLACTHCGLSFDELAPRNFSFNSPYGACERATGSAHASRSTPSWSSPTTTCRSTTGAIAPWSGFRGEYFDRVLEAVGDASTASRPTRRGRS